MVNSVCLLGGTFNPIHVGHIQIAARAHEQFNINQILVMPSGNPGSYKDTSTIVSATHRCNMIKLAIRDIPYMKLDTLELDRPGNTYTADTLRILYNNYDYVYFIIGADSLFNLDKWYDAPYVLKNCHFLASTRSNLDVKLLLDQISILSDKFDAHIDLIDVNPYDTSSSYIREHIRDEALMSLCLNKDVYNYIKENHLYDY